MNEKEALDVLVQAVMIGQQHGIYSLRDSSIIFQAINVLNPEFDNNGQPQQQPQQMQQQQQPQQQIPQIPIQQEPQKIEK